VEIDLIANDGSPLKVIPGDIYGRGVGGAELAMLSLVETFAKRGHIVRVYNDPSEPGVHNGVQFLPRSEYNNRGKRDALIVFRSPNPLVRWEDLSSIAAVWWSTDQYTVGSFEELSAKAHFCVTISPRHTEYHIANYRIPREKIGHIDLGVRLEDYRPGVERIVNRLIFCSVPDRGLAVLHAAWPLIKKRVPTASLVITSDYRLWGLSTPQNQHHRLMWASHPDVDFKGRVPRMELTMLQQQAEIHAYPCTYDELFCITAAECQVAGALPVTSTFGALASTNEWGVQIGGRPTDESFVRHFVTRIASLLLDEREYLAARRATMMTAARLRFDYGHIAEQWEYLFEHKRLPD
jgi:glycosyltransferase involved in cell wall biosynthesis